MEQLKHLQQWFWSERELKLLTGLKTTEIRKLLPSHGYVRRLENAMCNGVRTKRAYWYNDRYANMRYYPVLNNCDDRNTGRHEIP